MSAASDRIKQYDRSKFQFQPLFELGIASNAVNIKNSNGRLIGSIESKDVPAFRNMNKGATPPSFEPIKNWELIFSSLLMNELGLTL
jgi:hypothetical protein